MPLTGQAKRDYQREYMREYMKTKRGVKTQDLVKTHSVKTLLRPAVKPNSLAAHFSPAPKSHVKGKMT